MGPTYQGLCFIVGLWRLKGSREQIPFGKVSRGELDVVLYMGQHSRLECGDVREGKLVNLRSRLWRVKQQGEGDN